MSPGGTARPPDAAPCLVIGTSARLPAEALANAGLQVHVRDSFADLDCRAVAQSWQALPWSSHDDPAPDAASLRDSVGAWAAEHPNGRMVVAAGFEHRPQLLAELASLLPLCGSPPACCAAAKDPWHLAALCRRFGLNSPELARPGLQLPRGDWLARAIGGCGGGHLHRAHPDDRHDPERVWQREVPGMAVSLLFHACGATLHTVSAQRQHLAPAAGQPWRFGGLVGEPLDDHPAQPAPVWLQPVTHAAALLAPALGLRGLNGLDALWDGERLWVLEINPRPTASLALLPMPTRAAWMQAHHALDADVAVHLADLAQGLARTNHRDALNAGMAVVYASARLPIPADFRFPPGCHDLPPLPCVLGPGAPVCSLQVSAGGVEKLRTMFQVLRERLLPLAGAHVVSSL